jgi:tetratricopeptide (TPR) repeat protein
VTEEIINALTHVEDLKVIARTSAFAFKGKQEDIREIGKKLDVENLLEGSVRKAGNNLRITAQLIKVIDGSHLWSEKYDRELENIFTIQDEISLAIVEVLKVKLLTKEKTAVVKRHTEDYKAHNFYLIGRYQSNKRTGIDLKKSIEYYHQAIDVDPNYALAYVGIADSYSLLGYHGFLHPKETFPKAKEAVKKALTIDNKLGEVYNSLAWISGNYDWDWIVAEKQYKQAIEINPSYASAHHWYSLYLILVKRFDNAISEAKIAQELDPLSPVINLLVCIAYYCARQYDKAIKHIVRTIEMFPNLGLVYSLQGRIYMKEGKYKNAIQLHQKAAYPPKN